MTILMVPARDRVEPSGRVCLDIQLCVQRFMRLMLHMLCLSFMASAKLNLPKMIVSTATGTVSAPVFGGVCVLCYKSCVEDINNQLVFRTLP